MAELERNDYQVWGEKRKEALRRSKEIIESWGIRMPEVEPQVLDLRLGDFYKVGLIEYWIANNAKEGYCGKFLFVFDNQTCPYHHHNFKHETFFILKGKVKMKVGGKEIIKSQGDVLAMEQGTDHSFTGIGPALLLEVSKPCQPNDNIFENKEIGEDGVL